VNGEGERLSRSYDPAGRLVAEEDGAGRVMRVERDLAGRVIVRIDADGVSTRWRYDAAGRVIEVVSRGETVRFRWTAGGRLRAVVGPDGEVTRYRYDRAGRLVCVAGPGERVHTFERDAVGRVVGVVAPSGRTSFERDERGRVVSRAVASGETTRWTHHPSGRVASCTLRGGGTSWFRWDPAGRLASAVDANGDETRYRWDAAGFSTGVVDPLGGVETYANDPMGRMVASTDQLGHRTDVFVDRAGRVAGHRDPTGAVVRLARDAGGRVTGWRASPSGEQGSFLETESLAPLALPELPDVTYADPQWDAAGQLIAWRDEQGRPWARAYDAAGRMTRQTSPAGDDHLSYDAAGRLVEVVRKGPAPAVTMYRYDAAGRRTREMRCELGGVGSVRYRWDGLGRLREVHRWDGRTRRVTRIDIDPVGRLVGIDGELGDLVWLHHRVLDTATGSFLSPDPLGGVPGTPVVANPYHYAANDPVRLCDPLGLRPMTDADLEALRDSAARPVWQKAYDSSVDLVGDPISWAADHWETIVAAGLIVVGGVLVATGVGAPIGAGILVGASMSFAAQVAMTGEVDQKALLVSTAAGAIGGAIGGATSAMTVGSQIAIAAGSDAAISAGSQYALTGTVDPEQMIFDGTIGGVTSGASGMVPWGPEFELDPASVRFSQKSVNDVQALIESMDRRGWRGHPVDVVTMPDGQLTSIDNSRLLAAHYTRTELHARLHAFDDPVSGWRARLLRKRLGTAPATWGDAADLRIGRQSATYRRAHPQGSPFTGWRGN
jgi:RHS repeat-associated protein